MKRILGLIICSRILFALSGCNASASTNAAQLESGSSAVATRNPNTAQANSSAAATPPAPARNGEPQMVPSVMGTVVAVDGATITVQDSRQQNNVTVALTDNTQLFKQATIALANVSVGETLSAMGSLSDNVFTATQIRVGVDAAPADAAGGMPQPDGAGQPRGNGGQPPAGGQPPSGNQPPANDQTRPNGQPLFGTVAAVSSDALTVKTTSGSTVQVQLAANGQIVRQVAGISADLVPDVQVMVRGEQSDATITATRIDIIPALSK